ncbi:hypothetical protein [Candidatus Electrothrix sp.]|uniref:hypothetical protein n=1 Tax=Candidatus Electrothrix sp. TaxID=2170559 RepID=UPI0040563892
MMMKEKQNSNEVQSAIDPGYLMLAVYVLGVSFLVMFAWLGGSTAALENEQQGREQIVTHELMQEQPSALAEYIIADKG